MKFIEYLLLITFTLLSLATSAQELVALSDDRFILLHGNQTWEDVSVTQTVDGKTLIFKEDGTYQEWSSDNGYKTEIDLEGKIKNEPPYDDSGNEIFGRRVIYRNIKPIMINSGNGKVVHKVCINKDGIITFSELLESETTITDKNVLDIIFSAVYGYRFESDYYAEDVECGKLTVNVNSSF